MAPTEDAATGGEAPPEPVRVRGRDHFAAVPGAARSTPLLAALAALMAYAAFARGAVDLPDEARLQVALAAVALATAAVAATGRPTLADRRAWWGVGLLVAFAAWCAVTLKWSVAPDRTWQEANRALAYALVVVLGLAAARDLERVAVAWLAVATAVALYALAGRLGAIAVDEHVPRLRAPLQYWNALGAVCAFGLPVAIRVVTDATRRNAARLAGGACGVVLTVALGLTYSRGGVLAALVALAVITAVGGARLRGLLAALAIALASAPALAVGFAHGSRAALALALLAGLALLVPAGYGWTPLERRVTWTPRHSRVAWRALAALAVAALVAGAIYAPQAWDSFTTTKQDRVFDPVRLVSVNSANRWVWWKEAAGAWSDRPVGGWGAGSFPVTHKLYRRDELPVQQPHSVPLQLLAETGLVGFALVAAALTALGVAGIARIRALPAGRERDVAGALLAIAAAWLVHGLFDWDWDIPGVTLPALAALGALGAPARVAALGDPETRTHYAALGAATLLLAAFAASATLPALADSKASAALANPDREAGAAQAEVATRLDPLAVRPLFAAAAIAEGRGRLVDERHYLLRAVDRQPWSALAWLKLAQAALQLADRPGAAAAARRVLELDPASGAARSLATRAQALLTPPSGSATATGTPLTGRPAQPAQP
jgi:hypothetical protein